MENNIDILCQQYVMGRRITVYGDREKPLFLAKEISDIINYKKVSTMVNSIKKEELEKRVIKISGQNRSRIFINEENLVRILNKSRKPIAKPLLKAITEILKNIRNEKEVEDIYQKVSRLVAQNPEVGIFFLQTLNKEKEKVKKLKDKLKEVKSKEQIVKRIIIKENSIILESEKTTLKVVK